MFGYYLTSALAILTGSGKPKEGDNDPGEEI
jgi:hypothetical protein